MSLLIDTHTFLWFVNDDPQLSSAAATLLESDTTVRLSIASLWEIAIKVSIGKLTLAQPFEQFIPEQLALNDISVLPIQIAHCHHVIRLPFYHRDPFDRMIIAQAQLEGVPIVSLDTTFDAYGVNRLW
ncbi:MAG: type II toxin-antitoxin system VapC family toxin [Chloroflexota bacterium]|nr:type II toxin-antitoxin system VapC family toxin [Chloroflexota bacterium]